MPLAHYEDRYTILHSGEIISHLRNEPLAPIKNPNGYYKVSLTADGAAKQISIHRLVALHFIPNPYQYPQVNHKDGDKANNHCDNLEWCTQKQNIDHALRTGLMSGFMDYRTKLELLDRVLAGEQVKNIAPSLGRHPNTLHKMLRECADKEGVRDQWNVQMKENRANAARQNLKTYINNRDT